MTASPHLDSDWHPASWQSKQAQQQADLHRQAALDSAVAIARALPPLVVSWEIEALKEQIAAAQRGERFVLQGGDCAETFEDCESDKIAKKLKILLQMSLVLVLRAEEAGHPHRPHGGAVRKAAFGRYRDARRRDAAELPRRHRQSPRLHA